MMDPAPFHSLSPEPATRARAFWLQAEDKVRLRAAHWPADGPVGTVLLMQGRTEYLEKYARVATDLNSAGYDVLSLDWRGQGLSDRLMDNPRASHVDVFSSYQRDVLELVVAAQSLDLPRPWHLLAHSMGGTIGLAALIDGLPVETAVFSAPMWGINFPPLGGPVARALAWAGRRLGRGQGYVPGSGGDRSFILATACDRNLLTTDGIEWGRMVAELSAWPEVILGGVTNDWLFGAVEECARLATLPSPALPVLIGLGSREAVVSPGAIRARVAGWGSAELLELDGARHEPMMEREAIRRNFLVSAVDHFRSGA